MRDHARALFKIGVTAALPGPAMARALTRHPLPSGRLHLIAVGKAAIGMMRGTLAALPEPPGAALAVTTEGNAAGLPGVEVLAAGHPLPDAVGLEAAERVEALLAAAAPGDPVVALISGGGSALLPAPVAGVSLADKIEMNRLMLTAGIDIRQMNLVRQQLSRLKGGGLLRAAKGPVVSYVLSDVIGDDPRVIASGPTVAPIGTRSDARAVLEAAALWDQVPDSIIAHLSTPEPDLAPLPESAVWLIGSNRISLDAMAAAEPNARIVSDRLTGAVGRAAERIVAAARRAKPGAVLLFGGETTVRVTGDGLGGRNQELALRVAMLGRDLPFDWAFLSGGTDGRDGPTDAAGGLVDQTSARRMRSLGVDAFQALARSDSYHALAADGDLLMTGPTGTNVADLQIFVKGS
jgi:hydroxypyruvate reductase